MTRTCSECPTTLGPKNKSGRCRPCTTRRINADPAIAARRKAAIQAKFQEPEYRQAHIARCRAMNATISDELRERRRQRGKGMTAILTDASRSISPEVRAENGRKRSATALAWCPVEWRDRYRALTKRGRRAPEAKRIILDLIAGRPGPVLYAEQKSKLAWCPPARLAEYRKLQKSFGSAEARRILEADLTPFERQLARVAAGARLIEKPVFRKVDHAFTLGGVATGMI